MHPAQPSLQRLGRAQQAPEALTDDERERSQSAPVLDLARPGRPGPRYGSDRGRRASAAGRSRARTAGGRCRPRAGARRASHSSAEDPGLVGKPEEAAGPDPAAGDQARRRRADGLPSGRGERGPAACRRPGPRRPCPAGTTTTKRRAKRAPGSLATARSRVARSRRRSSARRARRRPTSAPPSSWATSRVSHTASVDASPSWSVEDREASFEVGRHPPGRRAARKASPAGSGTRSPGLEERPR